MKYLNAKIILLLSSLYLFVACNAKQADDVEEITKPVQNTVTPKADITAFTSDQTSFKPIVPKLAGKDIATYLESDDLSEIALFYYLGKTEASPDQSFLALFDSLSTIDPLNPLRWHLLNKVVLDADGALAETLSNVVAEKIEDNPDGFTEMLLDTTYAGRMEVAKNYAFLLAHDIQQEKEAKQAEDKLIIRAMLACSTCSDKQKSVLEHFFGMVDGLKD
jgi:hypothetical protein